jgi:pimeloyl-ACP methyl ester carboxylesterase
MATEWHPLRIEHHIHRPTVATDLPDIVCLHGICAGAWVFPERFVQPLCDAGFTVHTLSYRGHGTSEGYDGIRTWRLVDYVNDVRSILETLTQPPVILGHSLGSAITQILLRDKDVLSAAVLMSPVPPQGLAAVSWRLLWTDPMAYQQLWVALTVGVQHVSERIGARLLFSASELTETISSFFASCTDESPWLAADLQGIPRIGPKTYDASIDPPVLVVSGTEDQLIRPSDAAAVGRFYGRGVEWVQGGSHMLMYDRDAPVLADWIGSQLRTLLTVKTGSA